ncbi:hypothetical protein ZIOFF_004359 [Zingiber officinale]|uniref:RanBD1 domain-containing protein n=2 Tax=Zingiber officinale TaxID=94328 RepID=A0A8J5M0C6_ZINOF|nr:hypothetical protein ZIOFF_004359 [Zingiber officinale]
MLSRSLAVAAASQQPRRCSASQGRTDGEKLQRWTSDKRRDERGLTAEQGGEAELQLPPSHSSAGDQRRETAGVRDRALGILENFVIGLVLLHDRNSMASSSPDREAEAAAAAAGEDEDTGAQIAPIVNLSEVAVTTGEEEEDVLLDIKAKLYRFDRDGNQWKERGTGNVKLLKHRETGKVRLVMRQAKTLKICANHLVVPTIKIQEHAGNDKSCVWHASDFADGELKDELFSIRFGSVENRKKFMEMVETIAESSGKVEEKDSKDASDAAGLLGKLSVDETEAEKVALAKPEEKSETETKTE